MLTVYQMFVAMLLFNVDKATLSYSSVMGLQEDTHLTMDQYAWLGSIFSLGYLFADFPCAFIIQKVPLSKWVVTTMSIWGFILATVSDANTVTEVCAYIHTL